MRYEILVKLGFDFEANFDATSNFSVTNGTKIGLREVEIFFFSV